MFMHKDARGRFIVRHWLGPTALGVSFALIAYGMAYLAFNHSSYPPLKVIGYLFLGMGSLALLCLPRYDALTVDPEKKEVSVLQLSIGGRTFFTVSMNDIVATDAEEHLSGGPQGAMILYRLSLVLKNGEHILCLRWMQHWNFYKMRGELERELGIYEDKRSNPPDA